MYGTFSGEIEREADPLEAARLKAKSACLRDQCDLAIAIEGSFCAHPSLFIVPADDQIVVFPDIKNGIEVEFREVSTKTNFDGGLFKNWADTETFVRSFKFASHALILRREKQNIAHLTKGITT